VEKAFRRAPGEPHTNFIFCFYLTPLFTKPPSMQTNKPSRPSGAE
jgi:hypothetical protein